MKEYKTITSVKGPLIFLERAKNVGYGEYVKITLSDGSSKRGQVLETSENKVVVQIFEDRKSVV